jgi:hypothetical protein
MRVCVTVSEVRIITGCENEVQRDQQLLVGVVVNWFTTSYVRVCAAVPA